MEWDDLLDALAERVRAQEHAVDLHGVIPAALVDMRLPAPDAPMPQHLAVRALALLEQMRALEARAGCELSRLRSRHS